MEKALKRLNKLITTTIEPAMAETAPHDAGKSNAWIYTAREECEKIQKEITLGSGYVKNEKHLTLLIHNYQSSLVHLSDLLYKCRFAQQDEVFSDLYNMVTLTVDNLMKSLKHRYNDYFNIHGKVPDKEQHFTRQNIMQGWPYIKDLLLERGIDTELVDIITEPVTGLLAPQEPEQITWYRLAHIKELLLELDAWCSSKEQESEWDLITRLLYVNLNSVAFYKYCRKYFDAQMANVDDLKDKLDLLRVMYKSFLYDPVKPGIGYDAGMTDFRERLAGLLMKELEFLETDQKLFSKWQENAKKKLNRLITKIKGAFTVDEWGGWLRGEMDCGILLNKNLEELKDLVKMHFETPRQKHVSFYSMRQKSSTISNKSREKLMKKAKDMYLYFKYYGKEDAYENEAWMR